MARITGLNPVLAAASLFLGFLFGMDLRSLVLNESAPRANCLDPPSFELKTREIRPATSALGL